MYLKGISGRFPYQKWATDVIQMNIKGEKIYLSPILDLFNGEIISYSISKSPNMQMIDEMLSKDRLNGKSPVEYRALVQKP